MVRGAHNVLDWRGLAWLIEMMGLADRSEGVWPMSVRANRSEEFGGLAGPGSIKVGDWGPGRPGTVRHGTTTGRHGSSRSGTEHPSFAEELGF